MGVKKKKVVKMGYYNPKENIYYLNDNKWLDKVKEKYPNAVIQLSLLNDSDI